MKSVRQKRHVGDSRRPDGLLWQTAKLMPQDIISAGPSSTATANYVPGPTPGMFITIFSFTPRLTIELPVVVGTQMDKRKSGKWFFVLFEGSM